MQGNCGRHIKEIHLHHEEILKNIDLAKDLMSKELKDERGKIL